MPNAGGGFIFQSAISNQGITFARRIDDEKMQIFNKV
jgi:hypothetical protein